MELNDITVRELSLSKGSLIYFIGIGGSSMSGLAELSLKRGYRVQGSDIASSPIVKKLESLGVTVHIGHDEANIDGTVDLAVYTVAVSNENPEYQKAIELGIPTVERGIFLGWISDHFEKTVAVSGVHGKTTTTSMISEILLGAGMDPSVHVGGVISDIGSSVITGGSKYFVTEACEYHKNFLHIRPFTGIILNVEPEHLDYFKTFRNMKKAFAEFAKSIDPEGYLVVCADSRHALRCAKYTKANVITYSIKKSKTPRVKNALGKKVFAHFYGKDPVLCSKEANEANENSVITGYRYTLIRNGEEKGDAELKIPGLHNVSDSLAAAAAAFSLGCSDDSVLKGISAFAGAKRRFEPVGKTSSGAAVISDYAHHPSEIKVTVEAAKQNASGKVIAVFQPHTYSRVCFFKRNFVKSLSGADMIILTDIYAAREKNTGAVSSRDLEKLFLRKKLPVKYIGDFEQIADEIRAVARKDDMVLLLGAGTVNRIADLICE